VIGCGLNVRKPDNELNLLEPGLVNNQLRNLSANQYKCATHVKHAGAAPSASEFRWSLGIRCEMLADALIALVGDRALLGMAQ